MKQASEMSRKEKELLAAAYVERCVRQSRIDPNMFAEYVFLDEKGKQIEQQWFHREWQNLLTENEKLVIFSGVEQGKSVQTSVIRTLWELGRNSMGRGAIISDTATQASKWLMAVKSNIESNERLHDVFPVLKRENFRSWRDDAILYESSEPTTAKDFTVQAVGIGGALMGARLNWIILDDVLNLENTWTEEQCQKVIEWYQTTVLTRALEGCRIWIIGNAWSPFDLMHWLERQGEFKVVRYPAAIPKEEWERRSGGKFDGEFFNYGGDELIPLWPDQWTAERLLERERQLTPFRFRQLHMCIAIDEARTPFTEDAIKKCKLRGMNLPYAPDDWDGPAFTGVDLATGQTRRHAYTVFFTIGLTPDGDYYVLDIRSGRWHASQIEEIATDVYEKFNSIFIVESNAAQAFLIQFLQRDTTIPVRAYTTGRQKAHPEFGIESIAVEMMQGQWIVPNVNGVVHPFVQRWFAECASYTPQSHTGDHLMACFFAREALRRFRSRGSSVKVRILGEQTKRRRERSYAEED